MFFDAYPAFYDTSQTTPYPGRLNLRYEAIFAENRDIFEGASVLDIASHDGRWSLAALSCGAAHVVGVEGRQELVDHAVANLSGYGFGAERFTFIRGDVLEVLKTSAPKVDVVLCLGFLYHTLRYNELLYGIAKTGARHVVIDTQAKAMGGKRPVVRLAVEQSSRERNAVSDEFSVGSDVLTGGPNIAATRFMLDAYGYRLESRSDWAALLRDNPECGGVDDYAMNRRATLRFARKVEASAQAAD